MSEVEVYEGGSVVLPHSGEVVDITEPRAAAKALYEIREIERALWSVKRTLSTAIADAAKVEGVRTLSLGGGLRAEIKGGTEKVYDAQAIERELREAGMPEARVRQIVREEVTYTVVAKEAKRAAGANEEYAAIIARNTMEVERAPTVTIRRR